jgi:SsrA-binding protein
VKQKKIQKHIEILNRKASFEYFFLDKFIAGIQLSGTEIKSIRLGDANLNDAYCYVHNNEVLVRGMHIAEYSEGTYYNHEPKRDRKLLLNKKEIVKIAKALDDHGVTIIPIKLFISEKGWAKLEISIAKGKKTFDKRDTIKERDIKRAFDRGMLD